MKRSQLETLYRILIILLACWFIFPSPMAAVYICSKSAEMKADKHQHWVLTSSKHCASSSVPIEQQIMTGYDLMAPQRWDFYIIFAPLKYADIRECPRLHHS